MTTYCLFTVEEMEALHIDDFRYDEVSFLSPPTPPWPHPLSFFPYICAFLDPFSPSLAVLCHLSQLLSFHLVPPISDSLLAVLV